MLFVVNVGWFFLSHRLPLALYAKQCGFKVHVAATTETPGEADRIRAAGLVFHLLRGKRGSAGIFQELMQFIDIIKLIKLIRPQVIHAVTAKPIVLAGIAARFTRGTVLVGALTGLGYLFVDEGRDRLKRWFTGRLLGFALAGQRSRLVVQNAHDRNLLVDSRIVRFESVRVVPGSGVDTEYFTSDTQPAGTPVVLLSARMLRDKGIEEFCLAAKQINAQGVCARFVLVGGMDLHNPAAISEMELMRLVGDCGVEWWGVQSDMRKVIEGATIVCLPSYREGLSKSLIEAASMGRAIVTTDVPGCRDVIRHDVEGLLVPARDWLSLAAAIRRLLADSALRDRLARAAQLRARTEFDVRKIVAATVQIYSECLGNHATTLNE